MTKRNPWIIASCVFALATLVFGTSTIYYRLKCEDERVLMCNLLINDILCLATNGIDTLASSKDRQMRFYFKEFNSSLRSHPGRNYFLQQIRICTEKSANAIRKRGVLSEVDIKQFLSITNAPQGGPNYHFDM